MMRAMTTEEREARAALSARIEVLKAEGQCPTCYDQKHGDLYQDDPDRIIYEDDEVTCLLEHYPRNPGHTIIVTKQHYEDISEMPLELGTHILRVTQAIVAALKQELGAEKVYLCTMCDGTRNHLHFQLIPRDRNSPQGSKVFVKERGILSDYLPTAEQLRSAIQAQIK